MTTGENIRRIRKERGYTQKQLADMCEMYESQIRKYELDKANPKIETLEKIAAALDCTVSDIRGFDGSIRVKPSPEQIEIGRLTNQFINDQEHLTDADWKELGEQLYKYYDPENISAQMKQVIQSACRLLDAIVQLNETGQKEAAKRIEELTEIPRYTEPDTPPQE